jgi:hypothetical protein
MALLWSGVDLERYIPNVVAFFAANGHLAMLRLLLGFGLDPTLPAHDYPLNQAAHAGMTDAIDILLRHPKINSNSFYMNKCVEEAAM